MSESYNVYCLPILQGSAVNRNELQRCGGIGMLLPLLTATPSAPLLLAREGLELVTSVYELWQAVAALTVSDATATDATNIDTGESQKSCSAAAQVMCLLLANFELWQYCSGAVQVAAALQLRDAVRANSAAVAAVLSVSAVLSSVSLYTEESCNANCIRRPHSGSVDSATSSSADSSTGAGCSEDSSDSSSGSGCSADEQRSIRHYLLDAVRLLLLSDASASSSDGVTALLRYAVSTFQQPDHTAEVRSSLLKYAYCFLSAQ
jgi:Domain of unknown function (DUF4704)